MTGVPILMRSFQLLDTGPMPLLRPVPTLLSAGVIALLIIGEAVAQAPEQPGQPGQPMPGQPMPGQPAQPMPPAQPAGPTPIVRGSLKRTETKGQRVVTPLGPDGKVQLNFVGQKWLDVLEWYADLAALSLDWQELPGDELNLRTQHGYSVADVRDILNRHLLDRGYTLLLQGEVLTVANLKKLDAGLLPRVALEELDQRQGHEFVKVSFRLDWLVAEQAVEELKPMLSPYGKLVGLKATNRIEAIDAVANLREIASLLSQEQSANGQERLVQEFKLQHVRADDVYSLLMDLLGQEKPKKNDDGVMDPRKMMQMQQQMQMMQQMQQQGGKPASAGPPSKVYLVVNTRENSILANGPPNLVAVVAQAVKTLDVPSQNEQSLLQNPNRMQVYRLSAVDPDALAEVLQELGQLDPTTQVKVDKKNKSIIVQGPLADHLSIRQLVERLDGTDRRFEVVRLRRLEAEYVAGTIEFMMGAGDKKQQNNRRNNYYYDPFGMGGGNSTEETNARQGFRVDADVEHNRLLIWANEVEMTEVNNLLQKLGEIPAGAQFGSRVRRLDSLPAEDSAEMIKRLREMWPGLGDNPLIIEPTSPPAKPEAPSTESTPAPRSRASSRHDTSPSFRFSKSQPQRAASLDLTAVSATLASAPEAIATVEPAAETTPAPKLVPAVVTPAPVEELLASERSRLTPAVAAPEGTDEPPRRRPRTPPPIHLVQDASGQWSLQSEDTGALDRIEDLLQDLTPPRKDYRIFQMKHRSTWAYGVSKRLEDFFTEEKKDKDSGRNRFWYYDSAPASDDKERSRLSKRKPLKFIPDSDSNSILVTGADPAQMRIIEELIAAFDVAEESENKAIRKTKIFPLKYTRARVVAEAIKDVYRDLLSENDKALANQQQKKDDQRPVERTVTYIYDPPAEGDSQAPPSPVRFKGLLSIGVDELSNTLIVSATEALIENVGEMIESLDNAARPVVPTIQVLQVQGVGVEDLQKRLDKILKEPKSREPKQPNGQQPGQPNGGQPPQQQGRPFDED